MGQPAKKIKPPKLSETSFVRAHMPKRPREVADRIACKELAGQRIREFLWELGLEKEHHLWMAHAARRAGLNYSTARSIIHGEKINVGPDVVDQISMATGCPVSVFYDVDA